MNFPIISYRGLSAIVAISIFSSLSYAGKEDNTVTVIYDQEVTNYDFYLHSGREASNIAHNICDGLVGRDLTTMEYKPLMAESWTWIDPHTIEFKLRQNITFHNGDKFTAYDVVYTLNYAKDPETKAVYRSYVGWIDNVEKIDDYTVRVRRKTTDPAVLDYLTVGLPIYPGKYHAEVGSTGFSANPVCAGPYKITSIVQGQEVILERNQNYYEGSPKYGATIDKVRIRYLKDGNVAMGELMIGEVDLIQNISPDIAENLKSVPGISVKSVDSNRLAYILLKSSDLPSTEPMTDIRVRKAIAHAINRDAIAKDLVGGERLDTYCYPMASGCKDGVANLAYDPELSRSLLAEAGYPNGFALDFYSYRDRFVSEAVIGDLRKVGIDAKMNYVQFQNLRSKWAGNELSMAHVTYGGGMTEASSILTFYFQGTALDPGKDPVIIDAINRGLNIIDDKEREAAFNEAYDQLGKNVNWVPLYRIPATYAFKEGFEMPFYFDTIERYYLARWN